MKSGHLLLINDQQTSLNLSDACLDDFIDNKGISLLELPLLKNPRSKIDLFDFRDQNMHT